MNKTKIIATIGPASQDKEVLKNMIINGMDVARINLSYADHSFCRDIVKKINELNAELNTFVAVMFDTKGPDIKIDTIVGDKAFLKKGDKIRIYKNHILGDSTKFSTSYEELVEDIKYNTVIKMNEGKTELLVIDKKEDYLLCQVLNDGIVESNKSINIPGAHLNRKYLSSKDIEDIKLASSLGVDYIALSFVSCTEDVLDVNDLLIELEDDHIGIIAKVENERGVNEIDEIIDLCEGIMVARGDLGAEIPMERIPGIQKRIINKCHDKGKISIVATEMLASMESEVRPTRAEVSDVANATLDGVDAVMLSGETTIGVYPTETILMMGKIIESAEENMDYLNLLDKAMRSEKQDITGTIAYSVCECANRLKCKAIVAPTRSGYTARKISRFHPSVPIIAVTPDVREARGLSLYYGVIPAYVDELNSLDKIIEKSKKQAISLLELKEGDKLVITGGYPFKNVKHTNFMKIEEL